MRILFLGDMVGRTGRQAVFDLTAVVAQQIYYRYKRGHTSDKRFEKMLLGVKVLSQYALAVIARGTL